MVMTFLDFIMFLFDVILGHIPPVSEIIWSCRFAHIVLIERMSLVMIFSFISSCFYWIPYWGIPHSYRDHLEVVGL